MHRIKLSPKSQILNSSSKTKYFSIFSFLFSKSHFLISCSLFCDNIMLLFSIGVTSKISFSIQYFTKFLINSFHKKLLLSLLYLRVDEITILAFVISKSSFKFFIDSELKLISPFEVLLSLFISFLVYKTQSISKNIIFIDLKFNKFYIIKKFFKIIFYFCKVFNSYFFIFIASRINQYSSFFF
jgi:hypothetical protein